MLLIPNRPEPIHTLAAVGLDPAGRFATRLGMADLDIAGLTRRANTARSLAVGHFIAGIGRWFDRHVIRPWRAARERNRAIAELSRMDDYMLHDLGLTRSGIVTAVEAADDIRHVANENKPPRAARAA